MIENIIELEKSERLKKGKYKVKFNKTILLKKGHWGFVYRLTNRINCRRKP